MPGEHPTGEFQWRNPFATFFFQADAGLLSSFFRQRIGQEFMPWYYPLSAALLVGAAAPIWLTVAGAIRGSATFNVWGAEAQAWFAAWVVVTAASVPHAWETWRRYRTGNEILTTFVGFSRFLNWKRYEYGSRIERHLAFKRATLLWEPLAGLGIAIIAGLVSPSLGAYIALNTFLLWSHSALAATSDQRRYLRLRNAFETRAFQELLLEELMERERPHREFLTVKARG